MLVEIESAKRSGTLYCAFPLTSIGKTRTRSDTGLASRQERETAFEDPMSKGRGKGGQPSGALCVIWRQWTVCTL